MLALTKEKLISHALEVPNLVNLYQKSDGAFLEKTIDWLWDVENSLVQLRNPLASVVAEERAKIIAINDGYIDPNIQFQHTTKRKAQRVTIVMIICRVDQALQSSIDQIDSQLNDWREKMAQFMAVALSSHIISFPDKVPQQEWLIDVWNRIPVTDETRNMYNYLNTAITQTDRLYILNQLLDNIIE